tara:strand:- start:161 stop:457 length:297 start_codon:yes stop_codon:yes gene_type:complete
MSIISDPSAILPAMTAVASVVYYVMITRKQGTKNEDIESLAAYGYNYFPMPSASAWITEIGQLVPRWPTEHMEEMTRVKKNDLPDFTTTGEGTLFDER